MINIIGTHGAVAKILKTKNTHLHLYNKKERKDRKLGHVTITADSIKDLDSSIETLKDFLP